MNAFFKVLFGLIGNPPILTENKLSKDIQVNYSRKELKNVLNRLYKCRDLEISNLWQRSIFLSVFLVLCFTGYGYLLLQIIDSASPDSSGSVVELKYLNFAAIALGCVSSIFSLLWIYMSKASKAWYEVYETAITRFENEYKNILNIPEDYIMGMMGLPPQKKSNNVFSAKSGAYSPSRINIVIGQVCLCIWIVELLFHIYFAFVDVLISMEIYIGIIISFVFIVFIIYFLDRNVKSGHLSEACDRDGRIL